MCSGKQQISHVVVTCDEDWQEHGEGEWTLPTEEHTMAEARAVARAHAEHLGGLHRTFRVWVAPGATVQHHYKPRVRR